MVQHEARWPLFLTKKEKVVTDGKTQRETIFHE